MSSKPALFDEDAPKFERSVHRVKLSCSSSKDNGNKENMSMNKEEVPMMSMEPIPMKRKKKGGAYNLRKSLAWDRAFFTEEGILDPVELSVISGTCSNNVGQALSAIAEIGSYFKRADSRNMRKEALQKMSTVHCASGSGAKSSGCPQSPPTSSLERPAFGNTSRSSSKELRFFKTAIPKPSMCSIPRSAKSSVSAGSQLQHNQFVQSAANKQTCTGSSKISPIKSTPQVKDGSAVSPSTSSSKLFKGNSATTSLRLHPSTKIHQPPVSKVSNTCLKNLREVDALGVSQNKGNGSVDIAHIPQRTTAGKNMHRAQFQAKKPSGLRMPTPSLGFFAQPKVSTPSQPTLMSFKPNIPGLCYVRDRRKGKILHDTKSSLSTVPLSSTEKLALSDSDGVPCEISKPVLQQNTNKFVHAEISNDEVSMHGVDPIDKADKVHAHHETSGRIIFNEASEQEINDTGFLPQPEDGDMEKNIQGFQACKKNDGDSTCSLSMCQKLSALSWQHEGDIISNSVTSPTFTSEMPLAADHVVPDKKSLAEDHHELPMKSYYQSLEHNMNKSEHDEISYDELPMHGVDAVDKSHKVYAQHETSERIIFRAVSEHKINDIGLLPQLEDGDMDMSIQGFQACRSNPNDSTCSLLTSQKLSALSGQHEGETVCDSVVTSLSFTSELPFAAEDIVPDKTSSIENLHELPAGSCYKSLEQNMNKSEHTEISYDDLATHGANAVDKSDKVHAQHETSERFTLKAISDHDFNDTELLTQQEDDVMEKSIQGFQSCRNNDSDPTCCPSMCQKLSALSGQHEGESICNSALTSLNFTCKFPLEAEGVDPDKKSITENHLELPMESCYQSLEQSDDANLSAPEVPDSKKKYSAGEVPEDNTCNDVKDLAISGEMKCQAPESCDSELESSCFLSSGKYKNCSIDACSKTKVDEETYLAGVQSYAVSGMESANIPKNQTDGKAVTADMEYSEKHWEAERIHTVVEGNFHCNLELGATRDLLPEREPVQEKVAEVPSSTAPKESDKKCENTSFIKKISLQGAVARDGLEYNPLEDKDNAEILFKVDTSDGEELTHNSGSISVEKIKNSEKNSNKIERHLILPKDLVPFSEEWLAAIEAAGEDVLTRKTGAVQNSPTDKSLPKPGPWSPVKRKSNGPFDCTKYTNLVPSESPQ